MSEFAIRANDVSKAYLIGLKDSRKETLGAEVFSWLKSPLKNYNVLKRLNTFNHNDETDDLFWALRNISFELKHGETLGIIGDNGAGKSTLLKIISRITHPTFGFAEVNGKVASLLEVGTGFNNDLTGRENVYLNGTILGMSKKEIDKKFDEIVDFSGVEKFIDTQIKKYSNGMRIRLAFSVAAFIETEVMIIDEVLSIGDAEFRKKSLTKMTQVAKSGTAIILVSHNMLPIQSLCKRTIWLEKGILKADGSSDVIIPEYLGMQTADHTSQTWSLDDAPSSDSVKLIKAEVRPFDRTLPVIRPGDPFEFEFVFFNVTGEDYNITITFHLMDEYETLLFIGSTALTNLEYKSGTGYLRAYCRIPADILNAGKFSISKLFVLKDNYTLLYEHNNLLAFEVTSDYVYEHGKNGRIEGIIKPKLEWEVITGEEVEAFS